MTKSQQIFLGIIIVVVVGFILVFLGLLPGLKPASPTPFTLEVWGFEDADTVWRTVSKPFESENTHIKVKYTRFNTEEYETILLNRLAENTGPDVFMLKNSWLSKHRDKIYPLPQQTFALSVNSFDQTFVDVAHSDLIDQYGVIFGLPLYIDSLALFYNKDILNAANIATPPKTWDEVVSASKTLTQISPAGDIIRSGIALGSARNIEHAFEMVSAMIMQRGDQIVTKAGAIQLGTGSQEALAFYASFADRTRQNFSWSNLLPNSIDAFAEEKTAMIVGTAKDIQTIKEKNPHINFGITAFPQIIGTAKPLTYGSYRFLTVSKLSRHAVDGWRFSIFVSGKTGAGLYNKATKLAPARRDILASSAPLLEEELFWRQALIAKSWPIPEYQASKNLFNDVVESISSRSVNPSQAFNRLKEQLRLLLP